METFFTSNQVQQLTKLSRTTIWRLEKEGLFPKRRTVGKRRVVWLIAEVNEWVANKIASLEVKNV